MKEEIKTYIRANFEESFDFDHLYPTLVQIRLRFGAEAWKEVLSIVERHEVAAALTAELYTNVTKIVKNLKSKGLKLAIFSNQTSKAIRLVLTRNDVLDYFDKIVAIEDVDNIKPNPEGLEKILDDLKIEKGEAFFIGDKEVDLQAGERAGIKTEMRSPDQMNFLLSLEEKKI